MDFAQLQLALIELHIELRLTIGQGTMLRLPADEALRMGMIGEIENGLPFRGEALLHSRGCSGNHVLHLTPGKEVPLFENGSIDDQEWLDNQLCCMWLPNDNAFGVDTSMSYTPHLKLLLAGRDD
jgi:hypothetical protein